MAATPAQQRALADDATFKQRVFFTMVTEALVVVNENAGTANHAARLTFALTVLKSAGTTTQIMNTLVNSVNLVAAATTYDFEKSAVVSSVDDAGLFAQIAALWDTFAAIS